MSLLSSILLKLALGAMLFFIFFIYMGNVGGIADNKSLSLYIETIMGFLAVVFASIVIKFQLFTGPDSLFNLDPYVNKVSKKYKIAVLIVLFIVIFLLTRRSINNTG